MAFKYVDRNTGLDFPRYANPLLDVIKTRPYMGFGTLSVRPPLALTVPRTALPPEEESFYYPPTAAEKEEPVTTPTIQWIGTSGATTTTPLPPKEEPVASASRTWTTAKPSMDTPTSDSPTYPDVASPLAAQQNAICGPGMQQMQAEDGTVQCVPKIAPDAGVAEEGGWGMGAKIAIVGAVAIGAFLLLRR